MAIRNTHCGRFAALAIAVACILGIATAAEARIGLFHQGTSTFHLRNSATPGGAEIAFPFGPPNNGWKPLAGDWNGDGLVTVGLYVPGSGIFALSNENAAGAADLFFRYGPGGPTWQPVVGDWDGDGVDTVGLYERNSALFLLRNSNSAGGADIVFQFGAPGNVFRPVAGDWDNDGIDEVALYDNQSNQFHFRTSHTSGGADLTIAVSPAVGFGIPIAGDFDGDGQDTVATYDKNTGTFHIYNQLASGNPDSTFRFGPGNPRWLPIAWEPGSFVTPLNPFDGHAGFLWKPSGDHTSQLVVLLPPSFNGRAVAVEIHTSSPPNQTTFVEAGRYTGIANGNRTHWRFRRPGQSYGQNVYVIVFTEDGQIFSYFIPNGANRVD